MVTADRLRNALALVESACEEWVDLGLFSHGVLVRFRQWRSGLPSSLEGLAGEIARMAAQTQKGTGAVVNGVALDEKSQPSVESLMLFYSAQQPLLFPNELVQAAKAKLNVHSGPRYTGPWP